MSTKATQLKACLQSIQTANEYMLSKKTNDEVVDLAKGHLVGWIEVLSSLLGDRQSWEIIQTESDYLIRRDFQSKNKINKVKRRKV